MSDAERLFDIETGEPLRAGLLDLPDADVRFVPKFLATAEADRLLAEVGASTAWRQETIKLYGRESPVPRLTAWYGEPGTVYTYSNIAMEAEPWSRSLLEIKARAEREVGARFNSVLCNLYRTGRDSVAWHSDDEPELGPRPVIASVSLGATRVFQFRHKVQTDLRHRMELPHGSLLLMCGPTQHHWRHQVPKTARDVAARINLTFRAIERRPGA